MPFTSSREIGSELPPPFLLNMCDLSSMTVLVAEDDKDTCANRCDILELDGYRVAAISTMAEALAPRN